MVTGLSPLKVIGGFTQLLTSGSRSISRGAFKLILNYQIKKNVDLVMDY